MSRAAVGQVKAQLQPTGAPPSSSNSLVEVSQAKHGGLCVSVDGYTPDAQEYAQSAGVSLFRRDYGRD